MFLRHLIFILVNMNFQSFRSPSFGNTTIGGIEGVRQVDAKYPATLFKEQLTAYIQKIYGITRDNEKKELTPLLSSCVEVVLDLS